MEKEREKVISELDEYMASCKTRLGTILATLGWNEEDTLRENPCVKGAPDEEKDDKDDPPLPESFDCMHSIVVGKDQLKMILKTDIPIPKKFSDIQLNFTKEQKREIYDYVIFNTGKISEPELKVSVSNENQPDHDMTFAEIVAKAKKKDKKLKRKYRTSKPTHIEEVRNLVHLQMQALAQYFNPGQSEEDKDLRERDKDLREKDKDFRRRDKDFGERRSRDRYRRRSRSRGRRRDFSERSRSRRKADKTKSRSRSRSWERGTTVRMKRSRSHSRDSRSRSRDKRKKNRRSPNQSRSPSAFHSKSRHKSSKKSKKHTRSRSKPRHKSSKSKKSHKKDKRSTEATSPSE